MTLTFFAGEGTGMAEQTDSTRLLPGEAGAFRLAGDGWGVGRGSDQATGPPGVSPAAAGGGTVSDGAADGNVVRVVGGGTSDGHHGDGIDG